jgi:alkylhydroperoxidase family enzyme
MSRLEPLDREQAGAEAQPFFDQDEHLHGLVLNTTRILAYRPPVLAAARGLSRSVAREASLPADLRALICVRVATLVGCPF